MPSGAGVRSQVGWPRTVKIDDAARVSSVEGEAGAAELRFRTLHSTRQKAALGAVHKKKSASLRRGSTACSWALQ